MDDYQELPKDEFRLSSEQQAEIGDILLSARAVSRHMIAQAQEKCDAKLREAGEQAEKIVAEAEERAAAKPREAEEQAEKIIAEAEERAAEKLREAEEQAEKIIAEAEERAAAKPREAEEQAEKIIAEAEERAAEKLREAEEQAEKIIAEAEERAAAKPRETGEEAARSAVGPGEQTGEPQDAAEKAAADDASGEQAQEYAVRYVGELFARMQQRQQETADFLNEQWRGFLCGLVLPGQANPDTAPAEQSGAEIGRQEIEERVSAIAKELMEIMGKQA